MIDNKEFWNRWAKRYDTAMSNGRKTYENLIGRMKKVLTRNMTVLELACGTGLLSVRLAGSVKMLEADGLFRRNDPSGKNENALFPPAFFRTGRNPASLCTGNL